MSEITPILEKLFQNQPLSGDEKTILRTAFDGSTLQINWWVHTSTTVGKLQKYRMQNL